MFHFEEGMGFEGHWHQVGFTDLRRMLTEGHVDVAAGEWIKKSVEISSEVTLVTYC